MAPVVELMRVALLIFAVVLASIVLRAILKRKHIRPQATPERDMLERPGSGAPQSLAPSHATITQCPELTAEADVSVSQPRNAEDVSPTELQPAGSSIVAETLTAGDEGFSVSAADADDAEMRVPYLHLDRLTSTLPEQNASAAANERAKVADSLTQVAPDNIQPPKERTIAPVNGSSSSLTEPDGESKASEVIIEDSQALKRMLDKDYETQQPEDSTQQRDEGAAERPRQRRPPHKRGGRPRRDVDTTHADEDRRSTSEKEDRSKDLQRRKDFEILCWKARGVWHVGILASSTGISFYQNERRLEPRSAVDLVCELHSLDPIKVIHEGSKPKECETIINLGASLRFFRYSVDLCPEVPASSVNRGIYLVLIPVARGGRLNENLIIAEQSIGIEGLLAYLIDIHESAPLLVDSRTGDHVRVGRQEAVVRLEGRRLEPVPEVYECFILEPPVLYFSETGRERIKSVVIGEEGARLSRLGSWRGEFEPSGEEREVFPREIGEVLHSHGCGWYFLRFYDRETNLVDSLAFRFLAGIKGITVEAPGWSPVDGYSDAIIMFHHEKGYEIEPCDQVIDQGARECREDLTVYSVPNHVYNLSEFGDLLEWEIKAPNGRSIRITTDLGRLRWAVTDGSPPASRDWTSSTVRLNRTALLPTSSQTLCLWLPGNVREQDCLVLRAGQQSRVSLGSQEVRRSPVHIKLRDLGDRLPLDQEGVYPIIVSYFGRSLTLAEVEIRRECRFCGRQVGSSHDWVSHFLERHQDKVLEKLEYEVLRKRFGEPHWPLAVYRCSYCGFLVRGDDPRNPNSAISYHQVNECVEASKHRPIQERFEIIYDQDVIRKLVPGLPSVYVCRACDREFINADQLAIKQHMYAHISEWTELR